MSVRSLILDVDSLLHTSRKHSAEATASLNLGRLLLAGVLLGTLYGGCMGVYALLAPRPDEFPTFDRWLQFLATSLKLPLVFLLTYAICTPSLYVFATLAGSRERPGRILQILLARNAECLAVVASLGPITAFFTLSTESYPFMKLLNVAFLTLGGLILVTRLRSTIMDLQMEESEESPSSWNPDQAEESKSGDTELSEASHEDVTESAEEPGGDGTEKAAEKTTSLKDFGAVPVGYAANQGADKTTPPKNRTHVRESFEQSRVRSRTANRILLTFVGVLALVGGQVAWILRPFLGAPGTEFQLFRAREGNFYGDVLRTLGNLF